MDDRNQSNAPLTADGEPLTAFIQSACEELQDLRENVGILRDPAPLPADLERLCLTAESLVATAETCNLPLFGEVADKLRQVFRFAQQSPVRRDDAAQLLEFLLEAVAVLEVDLMMLSNTCMELPDIFDAFRKKYAGAFTQDKVAVAEPVKPVSGGPFLVAKDPAGRDAAIDPPQALAKAVSNFRFVTAPVVDDAVAPVPVTFSTLLDQATSPASLAGLKLLLIDNNVFFAHRLSAALRHEGMEVMHSSTSAFALTMLEWNPPSAILCGTTVRDMGVHEIPGILRDDPKTAHIPVIAMGDGGEQALMSAFRAGCEQFVDRRLGPEHVAVQVRLFLEGKHMALPGRTAGSAPDATLSGTLAHMDFSGLIQMLVQLRQNGALYITTPSRHAVLYFERGLLAHAESGGFRGEDAFVDIVRACSRSDEGIYKFMAGVAAGTRTILRTATELMLDTLRRLDEEHEHGQPEGRPV